MRNSMKKLILTVTILMMSLGTAFAITVPWALGDYNNFQDQSAEYLVDNDGDGMLSQGDYLRGIFVIDQITSPNYYNFTSYELTGFFEVEVTSRISLGTTQTAVWTGNNNKFGHAVGSFLTSDLYSYTFGTSSVFESIYGTGALLSVFLDGSADYQAYGTGTTIASGITSATDGSIYWTFGLGDTGEWTVNSAPEDLRIFEYATSTTTIASTQVGLNLLTNPVGPNLIQDVNFVNDLNQIVPVDLVANITLLGIGDLVTQFDVKDKVDGVLHIAPVPEPSTLALLGLGLISVGILSRKRK
jgi:hypothetical protein